MFLWVRNFGSSTSVQGVQLCPFLLGGFPRTQWQKSIGPSQTWLPLFAWRLRGLPYKESRTHLRQDPRERKTGRGLHTSTSSSTPPEERSKQHPQTPAVKLAKMCPHCQQHPKNSTCSCSLASISQQRDRARHQHPRQSRKSLPLFS